MSRVLDVVYELMLFIGFELSILSLFLVVVFSIKPFYGRVWLVSSVVFIFLTYIYKGVFSTDFELSYMMVPPSEMSFGDYILYRFIFDLFFYNAAKLSFFTFIFLMYFKKYSGIEFGVKDFLLSKKGSVDKKQYWFSMLMIVFLIIIPLLHPLFFSFIWSNEKEGYVDGVTMIFSKGLMISVLLLSFWFIKKISMRYWCKSI
jgi:hypothetical protein